MLRFTANIDPTRRYLYLQVLGGKAFLEHLQEPEPLPGQICSTFTLCLHFRNQRFRSKPVPCACEPDFQDGFLLEIPKDSLGKGYCGFKADVVGIFSDLRVTVKYVSYYLVDFFPGFLSCFPEETDDCIELCHL